MSQYIFAVSYDKEFGCNMVYVTDREEFENTGFCTDYSLTEELGDTMEGFAEEMEGAFTAYDPDLTKNGIIQLLQSRGLEHSESLQEFIEKTEEQ